MESMLYAEFTPVNLKAVTINGEFWNNKIQMIRDKSLPHIYKWLGNSGRLESFKLMPNPAPEPHIFWDSDVYKWLEAACYAWATEPEPSLREEIDETVQLICRAQQADGYLNVYFSSVHPERRWTDLEGGHELYCAGHLFEAAVAHYEATGNEQLITVAKNYADYLYRVFGPENGKIHGYPGHEEVELALIKLYRATENKTYLDLATYFVNERGTFPNYFDREREVRTYPGFQDTLRNLVGNPHEYNQSHEPIREQTEVVGHAVRAMYLYTAVADLYCETADASLLETCRRLWHRMTTKRMYLTGGLGSSAANEGFTTDYDLPLETAYAETCAAIGSVFWNHRLLQIQCDSAYADLMERTLYNAVLAAVSLDGRHFFYANPMVSHGEKHRQEWFDVSCCPPNLARLVLSLGQYVYSQNADEIAVHLFVQSNLSVTIHDATVEIAQHTAFPRGGETELVVSLQQPDRFGVRIRVPHWSRETQFLLNGQRIHPPICHGYACIEREWHNGDSVVVGFDKQATRIYAHPEVADCRGRVALQNGPIVYCLEEADNGPALDKLVLNPREQLRAQWDDEIGGGCEVLRFSAECLVPDTSQSLYSTMVMESAVGVTAVPYYLWGNRGPGEMRMWLREH